MVFTKKSAASWFNWVFFQGPYEGLYKQNMTLGECVRLANACHTNFGESYIVLRRGSEEKNYCWPFVCFIWNISASKVSDFWFGLKMTKNVQTFINVIPPYLLEQTQTISNYWTVLNFSRDRQWKPPTTKNTVKFGTIDPNPLI